MNKLSLRKKLINGSYKIEDYEGTKTVLKKIYKNQLSEKLIEYLINKDKQLTSLSVTEKIEIIKDILTKQGAQELEVTNDNNTLTFSFKAQPEEAKLKEPVQVVLVLKDGSETTQTETDQAPF